MTNFNHKQQHQGGQKPQNQQQKHVPQAMPAHEVSRAAADAKQVFMYGIIGVLVLVSSGWLISKYNKPAEQFAVLTEEGAKTDAVFEEAASAAVQPIVSTGNESISVTDQFAGDSVQISHMKFGAVSWVAIRDTNTRRVLGARRFQPGESSGEVALLRPTEVGGHYEAIIFTDDGDKAFDLHADTLVPGVASAFTTQ